MGHDALDSSDWMGNVRSHVVPGNGTKYFSGEHTARAETHVEHHCYLTLPMPQARLQNAMRELPAIEIP